VGPVNICKCGGTFIEKEVTGGIAAAVRGLTGQSKVVNLTCENAPHSPEVIARLKA